MKKIHPKEIVKEKAPLTNIVLNRDFSVYNSSLKSYMPDNNIREMFKDVFEESDLEPSEIDELRKMFFLYFKQHMELISDYKLLKVEFPALGKISPNIDEFCRYIDRVSKGFTKTNDKQNNIVDLYNQLLVILKELVREHQETYHIVGASDKIKYDDDFVSNKNKEWKRNFYDRNIKFKEVIIDNGLFF
jgi:hypothetical protein